MSRSAVAGEATEKTFTSAGLMHEAERLTGLSQWGHDMTFREGLDHLFAAIDAMPSGDRLRAAVASQAVALLSMRLRLEDDARRHPEILEGRIERPLIVAGLPRTGTSWLFELLALDPVCRAPLEWEAAAPSPPPEIATFANDPRIAVMQSGFDALLGAAPELATMHEFGALLPAECNNYMKLHFASSDFWAAYGVPRYLEWLSNERPAGAFTTHKRILQQLQWRGPRGRWTLKSPPHLLMIDELVAAYPDACIIQTHREPARTVASLANMVQTLRKARFPDVPDIHDAKEIAREVLLHFGQALERGTLSRHNPAIDRRFFDVAYRDVVSDPGNVIRQIYSHFDLPFTQQYEDRLAAHLAIPRSTGHGAHKYDMTKFGLDELDLPNRFPAYRKRFAHMLSDTSV